jgi:hypothetical protein
MKGEMSRWYMNYEKILLREQTFFETQVYVGR